MLKSLKRITDALPLDEIARRVGGTLDAPDGAGAMPDITGVAAVDQASAGDLTFVSGLPYRKFLPDSKAGAVLVATDFKDEIPMPAIRVANPRAAFAQVVEMFFQPVPTEGGIHPTAIVPATATVDDSASIGAYAVLGAHVTVGARTIVHPHVTIYDEVTIGADCAIHSGAMIREGTTLGDRVQIQNGALIGTDGFGFEPTESHTWKRVLQVGRVTLADDVEVQAGACIDRAAVGVTSIGVGTKIDNLVQVGHGCRVGDHALICGQVGLAGSTILGNNVVLGGQAGTAGHITVNDGAQVGAQSGVIADLEGGKSYVGSPALELRQARAVILHWSRLPDLVKRVKALEKAAAAAEAAQEAPTD